jgi:hypothetical protein
MASKAFRPKAEAEGLQVTFPTSDGYVDISEWPYSTENPEEQDFLGQHPLVATTTLAAARRAEEEAMQGESKATLEDRLKTAGGDPSGMTKKQLIEAIREAESKGESEAELSASDNEEASS